MAKDNSRHMPVKVYERILQLFEAEGINTIFGIPDPNFVHLFHLAEERGWQSSRPATRSRPASWPRPCRG